MCTSVIRVVDAKDPLTLCVGASPTSTSLSLSSFWTTSPKLPEMDDRGESSVEVVHTIVLGLPRVQPNTTKQRVAHFYPLRAPVNTVDDKFDWAPTVLGFRRRGAPERRGGTKS